MPQWHNALGASNEIGLSRDERAIPSQVYFNHFQAIDFFISENRDKYNLKKRQFFNELRVRNEKLKGDAIKKLLWNAWSTEYSLRLANQINSDEFFKFALHWHFPQAYYSVYLLMTAFHESQGTANEQHEKAIKNFGNSVKSEHYPLAISFYVTGGYNEFQYKNLPGLTSYPSGFTGLARINSYNSAVKQIANFLKSTRIRNAENKRDRLKDAKDKRYLNNDGEFKRKFSKADWDSIYSTIPQTTILNLLYRLRIKANYHDIESFVHADIDFRRFHELLCSVVDYLNFVHEAYLAKAMGASRYESILNDFPEHLSRNTSKRRFGELIKSLE